MNFKPITSVYVLIYPILSKIANKHGYALFCHGSLESDLDLFLFPWDNNVPRVEVVIDEFVKTIDGKIVGNFVDKPHNRKAIPIAFQIDKKVLKNYYIDLSFMESA